MATADRWLWHGYDYGFRRVFLGDARALSPIDLDGKWFNGDLADSAERFYRVDRVRHDPQRDAAILAYRPGIKPPAWEVRTNWRHLRYADLTDAERALATPDFERMTREAKAHIAAAAEHMKFPGARPTRPRAAPVDPQLLRSATERAAMRATEPPPIDPDEPVAEPPSPDLEIEF